MKRIIAYIAFAALFCAVLAQAALGAFSPKEATESVYLDVLETDYWTGEDGVNSIYKRTASGVDILSVSASPDAKYLSLYGEFDPLDLSSYSEIGMNIAVRGEDSSYPVTVTLYSETQSVEFKDTVSADHSQLYFPISESIASGLSSLEISVSSSAAPITYVNISHLLADNTYTYSYTDKLNATDVESEYSLKKSENGVTVYPEDGVCNLSPEFVGISSIESDNDMLVWIKLTDTAGGSVAVFTQYEKEKYGSAGSSQGSKEHIVKETAAQSVTADGIYSFIVKAGYEKLWFSFSSLPKDATVTVEEAGYHDMGMHPQTAGTITECRYSDKKINVTGAISTDVAVKYNGARLMLFAIHSKDIGSFEVEKATAVTSGGYSTKFTLSASMGADYWEYFYRVYLDTKDGFVPVGELTCADSSSDKPSTSSSVFTLHGADAADAFESNAASVILDVYAGKLLENEDINSASLYSYKTIYYFNRKYLSELDNSIRFYNSSGIQVYLRIYSDKDGYSFDYSPDDPDSLSLMCAVCSFLTERYGNVKGYIMGPALNGNNTGSSSELLESRARLIAVFSEALKSKNPSCEIVIPFTDSKSTDLQLYYSLLWYHLSKYKVGPLLSLYEVSSSFGGVAACATRLALIPGTFSSVSSGTALMWNVPEKTSSDDIVEKYKQICTSSKASNARFIAISLAKAEKSQKLYDDLKTMLDTENVFPISLSVFKAYGDTGAQSFSTHAIWDFTNSYNTFGWVSGGSFQMPDSIKNSEGIRVLNANSDESGNAGILIGKTDSSIDMTGMYARITLSVLSKDTSAADVSVILGSTEARAEFFTSVDCNTSVSILCDMTEYTGAGKIDYASVIVRGVPDACAQIQKIELCSDSLTEEQLVQKYESMEEVGHSPLIYALIAIAGAVTVIVFILLMKKQHPKNKDDRK